ncbi:hypothetical protein [Stutzerimonas stutzeri]|uniref:hypothetical protein n=1 Tax=Stutzerimonas stutzeri TaxID=316 RepID=UPI001CFF50F5|nr:hypothetical protein [Stutzerimonas stutzeri]
MARFFPVRSQCQFDTPGERRFAERLEDDSPCWSNVLLGPMACYPDFDVLHPRHTGKRAEDRCQPDAPLQRSYMVPKKGPLLWHSKK